MKWYETSYRRHLADMHIEDWNPEFLRDFSPEAYLENLKLAKIQTPMIYLQSHVGYSNFRSPSGHTHAAMDEDYSKIQRLIDLCHGEGMSVVGYYSLIYNTWAHDTYPAWRMINDEGKSVRMRQQGYRYGFCCPNNEEYRAFTYAQIDEIAGKFKLEGIFFDMLFWPDVCHCPACRARWEKEVGGKMPVKLDWSTPEGRLFADKRAEWMGEFAMTMANYAKKVMPGVTVEHNYACAVAGDFSNGSSERVNESCDYAGGDLYGDLYNHSFTAKYYMNVTKNKPFEYMTSRVTESLSKHTLTKSERALGLEVLLTAAHHGASFIIDAVDPRGTMDRRVYERVGKVFERQMPYEPYFSQGKHIEEVGVFYSTAGRYNPNGDDYDSKTASIGAVRKLITANIPVGVVSNGYYKTLKSYKAILAPAVAGIFPEAKAALLDYVREGGSLYFSGNGDPELLREFFGAEILEISRGKNTYVAPTKAGEGRFSEFTYDCPMPADVRQAKIKLERGTVLGTTTLPYTVQGDDEFASIHSNPPGIWTDDPAVAEVAYGKGKVIWSAVPLEAFEGFQYDEILVGIVKALAGEDFTVKSTAPGGVEVVAFQTEEGYLVSAVDLLSGNEDVNTKPFVISLAADKLLSVTKIDDGTTPERWYEDGRLLFKVENLSQFAMYRVQ